MKQTTPLIALALLLISSLTACSRSATVDDNSAPEIVDANEKRINSTDVVTASPEPVEIPAGDSRETTVRLTIQAGYHVNANPPTFPYLKATEIEIPASEGVSVGFIAYPNPITRQFAFEKEPLAVYEGETPIKVLLKADRAAKKGERHLPAQLRIQACDDQVCYAPGTLDFTIPVQIK